MNTLKYLGCFVIIGVLFNLGNNHVQRIGVVIIGFLITVAIFVGLAFVFCGNKKNNKPIKAKKEKKTGVFMKLLFFAIWLSVTAIVFTNIIDPWLKSIPK